MFFILTFVFKLTHLKWVKCLHLETFLYSGSTSLFIFFLVLNIKGSEVDWMQKFCENIKNVIVYSGIYSVRLAEVWYMDVVLVLNTIIETSRLWNTNKCLNKQRNFYLISQSKATPRWIHNVDGLSDINRKDVIKFRFVRFTILYTGHSYIVDVNGTTVFTAKIFMTGIILYSTLLTASARTPFLRSQLAPSRCRPCT